MGIYAPLKGSPCDEWQDETLLAVIVQWAFKSQQFISFFQKLLKYRNGGFLKCGSPKLLRASILNAKSWSSMTWMIWGIPMTYHDLSWLADPGSLTGPAPSRGWWCAIWNAGCTRKWAPISFRPLLGTLPHCTATAMQQFCFPRIFGVPCQFSGGKWSITLPRNNPGPVGGWNSLTWEHQKMFWS